MPWRALSCTTTPRRSIVQLRAAPVSVRGRLLRLGRQSAGRKHVAPDKRGHRMSLKDDYYATMVSQFKRWDARFSMLTEPGGETITMADARHTEQKTMRANRDAAYRKL